MNPLPLPEPAELSLLLAWRTWHAPLEQGLTHLAEQPQAALEFLHEAVRLSAAFHPRYHFLESRLHTLRGYWRAANGAQSAEADFRRAVALDHINAPAQAALAALAEGKTPVPEAYDKAAFDIREWGTTVEASALPSIHAAAADAERQFPQNPAQAEEMLSRAIALTDATHRHYHRLAALPWLARGKAFMLLGERELARNDARRGLDLDKENSGLKALLAS